MRQNTNSRRQGTTVSLQSINNMRKYGLTVFRRRPPAIGSGWFAWVKPVFKADDRYLMDRIGYDAVLFIRSIRLLRHLLLLMSIIGVCALIPINIVATYRTG